MASLYGLPLPVWYICNAYCREWNTLCYLKGKNHFIRMLPYISLWSFSYSASILFSNTTAGSVVCLSEYFSDKCKTFWAVPNVAGKTAVSSINCFNFQLRPKKVWILLIILTENLLFAHQLNALNCITMYNKTADSHSCARTYRMCLSYFQQFLSSIVIVVIL